MDRIGDPGEAPRCQEMIRHATLALCLHPVQQSTQDVHMPTPGSSAFVSQSGSAKMHVSGGGARPPPFPGAATDQARQQAATPPWTQQEATVLQQTVPQQTGAHSFSSVTLKDPLRPTC